MLYNTFQDLKLSALGLGCMRLPVIDGKADQIDKDAAADMVAYAMEQGVNYYDTAWGYHGGNSEPVMGEILNRYPRESYYIATKFPGYDLSNMGKTEEIFAQQLRRTGMDYFDFYLFHNVCELNIEQYLDDAQYGTFTYLMKEKAAGRIRHLGFSCHGTLETMKRFLNAYGKHMEFCQIQLNWLDWDFQDAKAKVALLKEWGIPVWVMEPLRGGKLAKLPEAHTATLAALRPEESIPGWAFRFLQGVEGVTMTLSGMSSFQQLQENTATFRDFSPLTEAEREALLAIGREMTSCVPCTACRYCTTHCPQELDIPRLIELYNEHTFSGKCFLVNMSMTVTPDEKKPSACLGCRSCEAVCPQNIKISEIMADFAEKLSQ